MKISVIMPVYNEINTIYQIVERVQKVKRADEILIVDDGSVDGTRELLKDIEKQPGVRVILHHTIDHGLESDNPCGR